MAANVDDDVAVHVDDDMAIYVDDDKAANVDDDMATNMDDDVAAYMALMMTWVIFFNGPILLVDHFWPKISAHNKFCLESFQPINISARNDSSPTTSKLLSQQKQSDHFKRAHYPEAVTSFTHQKHANH